MPGWSLDSRANFDPFCLLMSPRAIYFLSLAAAILVPASAMAAAMTATEQDLKLAGLYLKLGQLAECRQALASVIAAEPGNVEAYVLQARLELKEGKFAPALKAADSALALAPDDVDATIIKARALSGLGKANEAGKLLAHLPADVVKDRGEELDGTGARSADSNDDRSPSRVPVKTGEEELDKALDGARAALDAHRSADAERLTATALKLSPDNDDAIALRAEALSDLGRPSEAVEMLRKLKARHRPGKPFAEELALAYALQDAGQTDEARRSFEAVANDPQQSDSDRASARTALEDIVAASQVEAGEKALDAGDLMEAKKCADAACKARPDDADALLLRARVQAVTGESSAAVKELEALKAKTPTGKRFDGQGAYATALAANTRYEDAIAAWQEVADSSLFTSEERADARESIDRLSEAHMGSGNAEAMYGSFEEGELWTFKSRLSADRHGRNRWFFDGELDAVDLDPRLFPRGVSEERFNAAVGVDRVLNDQWRGHLAVGGFEDGAFARAGATLSTSGGAEWSLDFAWNDLARDTLLLYAMDGRQHSVEANVVMPLGKHFIVDAALKGRKIDADGTDIGHAIGTETQLRWHPFGLTDELYLAYALELKDFSGEEAAFDRAAHRFFGASSPFVPGVYDAVPDRINRHALQAHGSVPLAPGLTAVAMAEVAWRQETDQTEYGALAEVNWSVNARTRVNARIEFYSGGAGPNAGSNVVMATLGTTWKW